MIDFFTEAYHNVPFSDIVLEAIAFIFGIISVWFARQENIWVYPTGIICTVITTYLLYKAQYFGDMTMNIYYSIMSIYGWIMWSLKKNDRYVLHISYTSTKERIIGVLMFIGTMIVTYLVYLYFDYRLEFLNYIDIVTSGIFFTAMWYMAKKKIENWVLWIIADAITVPLYAVRGLGMLSLQYVIFLILAVSGYIQWRRLYHSQRMKSEIENIGL